jgi:hypothetical protein
LISSYQQSLNSEVTHIAAGIFWYIFNRLILASFHIRAYGRARAKKMLYCRNRADVAQLVEQRIRKTTVDQFTLENQQVFSNIFIV